MGERRAEGNTPVVYLLRRAEDSDPYEEVLSASGYRVRSLPVLRFEEVNRAQVEGALRHPASYGGLIVTSPRAVEVLADVLRWLPSETAAWHARPIFAVGPRTAEELRSIGFSPEGEGSGSADMLADHIVAQSFVAPLLFLCGDRRRDVLPERLGSADVAFEEICIYRTLLDAPDLTAESAPDWAVFFSPSGVEVLDSNLMAAWAPTRFAAMGETTAEALRTSGVEVAVVAASPEPAALAAAIAEYGRR
jgi:uroporphyrinogen-III synthase